MKKFNSKIKLLGNFINIPNDNELIKNEPMFFNSSLEFASENGNFITNSFIDSLPKDWKDPEVVFDSRVHMLMKNWYPCIPGFHHDDVGRNTETGQPDYDDLQYKSEHILGIVNADICPTVFAIGEVELELPPDGEIVYKHWHKAIEELIDNKQLKKVECPDKQLVYFDYQTFHSGQKAKSNGWRWFGRVSRHTDRVKYITNEIRRQVQVYLEHPMEGW